MAKTRLTKIPVLGILFILGTLLVAGCSSTAATVAASSDLSAVTRLALGTLKLENTLEAVTTTQASQLLTLWQAYQSLTSSDTSSQLELDALVKQIEGSMTEAQNQSIDAMDLADQSVSETLSTLGENMNSGAPASTPAASATSNLQGDPAGGLGGMPPGGASEAGGMTAGGDSSGLGAILNGTTSQGSAAATQSPVSTNQVQINPMLLQAVIRLLETRSQPAG